MTSTHLYVVRRVRVGVGVSYYTMNDKSTTLRNRYRSHGIGSRVSPTLTWEQDFDILHYNRINKCKDANA